MDATSHPAPGVWGHDTGPSELHLTAEAVKVLAHPLRSRLVSQLRRSGPSSATELAGLLGTNSGATSYHLRRLETVGLVADTGDGKGKERLWRAATEQDSWTQSELADDEDALTALNWLSRDYVRHFAAKAEQWLDVEHDWPLEWVDQLGLNDNVALVTLEQMTADAARARRGPAALPSGRPGQPAGQAHRGLHVRLPRRPRRVAAR